MSLDAASKGDHLHILTFAHSQRSARPTSTPQVRLSRAASRHETHG